MRKLWTNYKKQTPEKWRKIGDSLMATGLFIGTVTVMIPKIDKWVPMISAAFGIVGKFISTFFAKKDGDTTGQN